VRYLHTDLLGSPVAETDAAGTVTRIERYTPYGEPGDGVMDQGPGYTGHVTDALTGLTYAQQRYYDPLLGRFLSPDPVETDPNTGASFNRYGYANNNPYRYTDPDGREPGSAPMLRAINRLRQSGNASDRVQAVVLTAKYFDIEMSGVSVNVHNEEGRASTMSPNGEMLLGPHAFSSIGNLGASISHEVESHYAQWKSGMMYSIVDSGASLTLQYYQTALAEALSEVEAYQGGIDNARRFGLSADETRTITDMRNRYQARAESLKNRIDRQRQVERESAHQYEDDR
jgi:RHS repeat-associated protein